MGNIAMFFNAPFFMKVVHSQRHLMDIFLCLISSKSKEKPYKMCPYVNCASFRIDVHRTNSSLMTLRLEFYSEFYLN
jgi:hypothetical protein